MSIATRGFALDTLPRDLQRATLVFLRATEVCALRGVSKHLLAQVTDLLANYAWDVAHVPGVDESAHRWLHNLNNANVNIRAIYVEPVC